MMNCDLKDVQSKLKYSRNVPESFKSFDINEPKEKMKEFFEEQGYLVVDNVLSKEENEEAQLSLKKFFLSLDYNIDSPDDLKMCFANKDNGIFGLAGVGQSKCSWLIRGNKHVKSVFRMALNLSEDKKMICSFDGINLFRNPESNSSWVGGTKSWFHFDAGDYKTSNYVQGFVNLIDCSDTADAGLVLLPRSHITLFPHIIPKERRGEPVYITYMTEKENAIYHSLNIKETPFRVPMRAGSMVIWKSSVLHCNSAPLERKNPNPEQLIRRLVVYVCMMADPGNKKITEHRRKAISSGNNSAHQPDVCQFWGDPSKKTLEQGLLFDLKPLPESSQELI